jgi:RHS repeat-associated protein
MEATHRLVTKTIRSPFSTNAATSVTYNGLPVESTSATGVKTTYTQDALGRQLSASSPSPFRGEGGGEGAVRLVGIYTHYNDLGQVDWTMDAASNRTSYTYSPATGLQISVTDAVTGTVYKAYNAQGQQVATWGAAYPVAYEYDDFGRMAAMYTLRDSSLVISNYSSFITHTSSFDRTVWAYDLATGLLTNKLYSDNRGPSYTYTPDGKLARRTWARGITTDYNYDFLSQLTNISYSDNTPAVGFTFDRLGRQTTITDGTGTRVFTYNDALQLAAETNTQGVLQYSFDSLGRPAGFDSGPNYSIRYSFDALGRFSGISNNVGGALRAATYSYLPGSDLVSGYTTDTGFSLMRTYESNRNLITSITNGFGGVSLHRFDYVNDQIGRRTKRADVDISTVISNLFAYNLRSELVDAAMGTNQYNYAYDPIGNRRSATNNAEAWNYVANALNQYSQLTNNQTPITPAYDLDGNMTSYRDWTFVWDAENRLILASNATMVVSNSCDYMSRRVAKVVNGQAIVFTYQGWAMIREVSGTTTNSYVYGLDLSGTAQGAGTIGGILSASFGGTTSVSSAFYCYDANGNVTDLVGTNGEFLAQYQFDPYGNTISKTGTLADANPFRFSTKYLDAETGLYYYGYRYYQPEVGRWASRDPLGDEAFLSFQLSDLRSSKKKLRERQLRNASLQPLYLFVENRSSSEVDPLGLDNTGGGGENQVCCVTSPGSSPAPGPSLVCRTCANAVGANVLLQLSLNDIDGNDDVGGGNAFRHCLATCQSVRACGSGCARCFWDGRENPADPAGQQDLANNQVGYGIQGSCWDGCHNAWRNGQLTCQGLPCPPPP